MVSNALDSEQQNDVMMGTPMPSGDSQNGWIYSYCAGCMQADCSLKVYLKDGVVTDIEGNPDSPLNKGKVCIRAIAGIMGLYNPYRVKTPLKRTNPEKSLIHHLLPLFRRQIRQPNCLKHLALRMAYNVSLRS